MRVASGAISIYGVTTMLDNSLRPARALFALCVLAVSACGGPTAPPTAPSSSTEPPAIDEPVQDQEQLPRAALPQAPSAVPPEPQTCASFTQNSASCADAAKTDWRAAALSALAITDAVQRDAALAALEGCASVEPGLVRALRADLAPTACAEALVLPAIEQATNPSLQHTLEGLGLASRLARLALDAPAPSAPPKTKAEALDFFKNVFAPWVQAQARAIYDTMTFGSRLEGYGQGVVAVEAGMADMRFVRLARALPLPEEMAQDEEIREVYYAALDEALEPYKVRGRDAALVGLRVFRRIGIIEDDRLGALRGLLSETYGGRRIDALDALLLPGDLIAATGVGGAAGSLETAAALAASLPTYYASFVLSPEELEAPELLSSWARQGIPETTQRHFQRAPLDASRAATLSIALFKLGQLYWRADDFAQAAQILEAGTGNVQNEASLRLMKALAAALAKGPNDAAVMLIQGPTYPAGIGNVTRLDEMAAGAGPQAAIAAFNAGHLLSIVTPQSDAVDHFRGVVERFDRAAQLFTDPQLKDRATRRAKEARETLRAVERLEQQPPAGS